MLLSALGWYTGSTMWLSTMPDSARVTTMIRLLAADMPRMKGTWVSRFAPDDTARARGMYSALVGRFRYRPTQRVGGTARLISSRNSGSPQLAVLSARGLRFSVKAM